MSSILKRNNVRVSGEGQRVLVFAHGFGCSQQDWQQVAPAFEHTHRVVRYDLAGCGDAEPSAYDRDKYSSLEGHASDLLELLHALELPRVSFVGHSAGAMIGMMAAIRAPASFAKLALIGASPSYIDQGDYVGGSPRAQIEGVLALLESDYDKWCDAVVPAAMGNPERPELGAALVRTFKRARPEFAAHFGRAIFMGDNRALLPQLSVPTLVVQTSEDMFVPDVVGRYIASHVQHGKLQQLRATGHYPQLSAPDELIAVLQSWGAL